MIGGMGVVVGVMHDRARPYDECRPELIDTLAGHAHAVARLPGSARAGERGRVEELEESHPLEGRCLRGLGVVIDQNRERNPLVLDETPGVADIARPDRHQLGPERLDLLIPTAQLRGVRPAVQSTEVTGKDQHHPAIGPEIAEAVALRFGILKLDRLQCL